MFCPRLFEVYNQYLNFINIDTLSKLDNLFGEFNQGDFIDIDDFAKHLKPFHPQKIYPLLSKLEELNIIKMTEDDSNEYELLLEPIKKVDLKYVEYQQQQRNFNSFNIILSRLQQSPQGYFVLFDLKGYTKNVHSENVEIKGAIFNFTTQVNELLYKQIEPLFHLYKASILKQIGDAWLIYFENINDAQAYIEDVSNQINTKFSFEKEQLNINFKFYIHYIEHIEKVYRTDSLHFDIEGEGAVYLFMIEKYIEEELYKNQYNSEFDFLVCTNQIVKYYSLDTQFKKLEIQVDSHKIKENPIIFYYKKL